MKLSYFPLPFPDESLSSIFYRHHKLSASSSIKDSFTTLFGEVDRKLSSSQEIARITQKKHVRTLAGRLPGCTEANLQKLLNEHTTAPLGDFLEPSRNTREDIPGDSWRLRICNKCLRDDIKDHGATYWHRSHLIPDVQYCWKHATRLTEVIHLNKAIRPGSTHASQCDNEIEITKEDPRIKYAKISYALLNEPKLNITHHEAQKIFDYKIWKTRAVKTPYLALRLAKYVRGKRTVYPYCPAYENASIGICHHAANSISLLFKNINDFRKYIESGILSTSCSHPHAFQKSNPDVNWKWLYRYNAMRSRNLDCEEKYWLEKYDLQWMQKLKRAQKKKHQPGEWQKFLYYTTYICR